MFNERTLTANPHDPFQTVTSPGVCEKWNSKLLINKNKNKTEDSIRIWKGYTIHVAVN